MSWKNQTTEIVKNSKVGCKIRKRGCSSSSSSSLAQKYRFKRAILVGKKGGSTSTPLPTWKLSPKPSDLIMSRSEFQTSVATICSKPKEESGSVSARKLAATLWEINPTHSPKRNQILEEEAIVDKQDIPNRVKVADFTQDLSSKFPDPSYTTISEKIDHRPRGKEHHLKTSSGPKKLQVSEYKLEALDSVDNSSLIEIEAAHSRGRTHGRCVHHGNKNRLKEASNGLRTSKEILKVLNRVWGLEENNSTIIPLVSALRVELDRARSQLDYLIKDQKSNHDEIEFIFKCFADEKAGWKKKECKRIHDAVSCIADDLEVEKKLRRQTERLNKKLGKELADTKALLTNAIKELESEKRSKEILEQVCDELARGVGEDRAQVEKMKQESAFVREEIEKEREMLQLADIFREERVQMKLSEAKYQFEEKNMAVQNLKNELDAYLASKISKESCEASSSSPSFEKIKELKECLKSILSESCLEKQDEDENKDDSTDSDLHSIELNMDNNNWSYAQSDAKRVSIDREGKGRKSLSEKIQWGSICFGRGNSDDNNNWNGGLEIENSHEIVSTIRKQDYEDEIKRYKSVKSLRDHILSTSKLQTMHSFASPTKQWNIHECVPREERDDERSSPSLEIDCLKVKETGSKSEIQNSSISRPQYFC